MHAGEIPKNEWEEFFRDFTRYHQGWIASLDIFSHAMGAQKEANEVAFEAIAFDNEGGGKPGIAVMLGETTRQQITHCITTPTQVRFESEGESEVLHIEDQDDTTVLISCHRSAFRAKAMNRMLQKN